MKTAIPISIQILGTSPELFLAMEERVQNAEIQNIAGLNFVFTRCHREGASVRGTLTEIYTSKRAPWTGEDLPPVGTVCEFNDLDGDHPSEWLRGKVEYCSAVTAVVSHNAFRSGQTESIFYPNPKRFRPIRTPEQIAAEAKQAAITVIEKRILARMDDLNVRNLAEDLHELLQEMAVKP